MQKIACTTKFKQMVMHEIKKSWAREFGKKGKKKAKKIDATKSDVYVALEASSWIPSLNSPGTFDADMNLVVAYLFFTACCLAFSMFWTNFAILHAQGKMSISEYVV